ALCEAVTELQGRRHSPPYEGAVAVPLRKRTRSEMARPGWSLTSYVAECVLKHGMRATTPSAPLRWLRSIFLMAQPPLLFQEGNTLSLPPCPNSDDSAGRCDASRARGSRWSRCGRLLLWRDAGTRRRTRHADRSCFSRAGDPTRWVVSGTPRFPRVRPQRC